MNQPKYKFEDFLSDAPVELLPDASLQDKFAALEREVADLKVEIGDLKSDLESRSTAFDSWFRRHLDLLVEEAAKEFSERTAKSTFLTAIEKAELNSKIEQSVEAVFQREANELAKSVFKAICSRIQPHALR